MTQSNQNKKRQLQDSSVCVYDGQTKRKKCEREELQNKTNRIVELKENISVRSLVRRQLKNSSSDRLRPKSETKFCHCAMPN